MSKVINFLDCTLRDGGYYNSWDFSEPLVCQYLEAMKAAGVDAVELGFRSTKNAGFKGASAFTTDSFLRGLVIPKGLVIGVMVNGSELVGGGSQVETLQQLFPVDASESPVDLVRIACHIHEFEAALPAVDWLKEKGYRVGFNLMQIADCAEKEVKALAKQASSHKLDVLYFADSMGSMGPDEVSQVIACLRSEWSGSIGIHTHDNLGLALSNTLRSLDDGVCWVDSTVTGMGRGPGNARTEELAIEIAARRGCMVNLVPLMSLLRKHFKPMQSSFGWGTNPYYYLAGKYGIHPTYIQEMLGDSRYNEEDVLAVIEHLRVEGGKKFSFSQLDTARGLYRKEPQGNWCSKEVFAGRDVLLLGSGSGVDRHRKALEGYIRQFKPVVVALNTQGAVDAELIDFRVACHPVRLMADCHAHVQLPQPLITPYSMLPDDARFTLKDKEILDFGLTVKSGTFVFNETSCTVPNSLVVAYALAVATAGNADRVLMAGFDGFSADDPRSLEMEELLEQYQLAEASLPLVAITPTKYRIHSMSVYAF